MKKLLALLLALCVALSLCPVLAEETPQGDLIPSALTNAYVVLAAVELKEGESLPDSPLSGKIVDIPSPYSEETKCITVSIAVEGLEDCVVLCNELTGEGVETLTMDMLIGVTGTLKKMNDAFEYDAGCTLMLLPDENAPQEDEAQAEPADAPEAATEAETSEPLPAEEESAEAGVLSFLKGLGIDTSGYEAEITSAVDEMKNKLSGLKESSGGFLDSLKEGFGVFVNEVGSGLESLLGELNEGVEQTKSFTASELEQVREFVNAMLQEALKNDPDSEQTKKLAELAEAAKNLVEDNTEAVEAFIAKILAFFTSENP